jgi:mannose/fructose/N-acetylgalactosamine-specific phosphotransferase system component IID
MSAPQPGDKSAGFSGLILGAIALFVLLFGIVRMTNSMYAGEHAEKAGVEAPK